MKESVNTWYRNTIRNPKYRWWIILGSLVYLLSPLDISPDFIPVIGWIDDGLIATILVAEVSELLLERLKALKANKAQQTTEAPADVNPATTVDVDAVSVK
jgi:uncharacterized membrane protein YkvA (DUF1232 family)